jgi:hypothetical protein
MFIGTREIKRHELYGSPIKGYEAFWVENGREHQGTFGRVTSWSAAWSAPAVSDGLTWLCDCGDTTYGPSLGLECSILDGPAAIR